MVRSRAAFDVCKFADANADASADGEDHRQLLTVDEISEDVVLGSRLHAAGYKGVFVPENLATGEVCVHTFMMSFTHLLECSRLDTPSIYRRQLVHHTVHRVFTLHCELSTDSASTCTSYALI
jgi:hypothetical protein